MTILDNLVQGFAWSIIIIPIAVLIVGLLASYFMPRYRKAAGITLITLGALGTILFALILFVGFIEGLNRSLTSETYLFTGLLVIELATVLVGALSLTHKKSKLVYQQIK